MTDDILFTPAEMARFEQPLAELDDELRSLANEFRCKYYTTGGRGWPGRRLSRRRGLRTYEVKIVLNPQYLQDQLFRYELREQWRYDFGEIFTRLLSHQLLATFEPDDLADTDSIRSIVEKHLVAALRP